MSRNVPMPAAAILAAFAFTGCDSGGSGNADPACMANAEVICQKACECNGTGECSQEYPSGSSQTFNSASQCRNAWSSYCSDLPQGLLDPDVCAADLETAQCVDSGDHQAIELPDTCYRYLSNQTCMDYGERICNLACECDLTGGGECPVKLTSSFAIIFGTWGECHSNMVGSCDMELTGITDYPTCMQDLDMAACEETSDNTAIALPPTCWSDQ